MRQFLLALLFVLVPLVAFAQAEEGGQQLTRGQKLLMQNMMGAPVGPFSPHNVMTPAPESSENNFELVDFFGKDKPAKLESCWACSLVEGAYVYVFSFVFKLYGVIAPLVRNLMLLGFLFWFLWYVFYKILLKHEAKDGQFLREMFVKCFAAVFVIGMLSVSPQRMFGYVIDPLIGSGSGFARWILERSRQDNEILKKANPGVNEINCENEEAFKVPMLAKILNLDKVAMSPELMEYERTFDSSLKNLVCITRDYSATFGKGVELGWEITMKGLSGLIQSWTADKAAGWVRLGGLIPGPVGIVVWVLSYVGQAAAWVGQIPNFLVFLLGFVILAAFFYVGFTYLAAVLDIIVRLALVCVMMPIALASLMFKETRDKLAAALLFDAVKCAFRLAFLAVAMAITTYLLNELMTASFGFGKEESMNTLLDLLKNENKFAFGIFDFAGGSSFKLLAALLANTGMISAIMFVTMCCFMLIKESLSMADTLADTIANGGKGDTKVMEGLQALAKSSLVYLMSVKKSADLYFNAGKVKDRLATKDANVNSLAGGVSDDPLVARAQMLHAAAEGGEQWDSDIANRALRRDIKKLERELESRDDMTEEDKSAYEKENKRIARRYGLKVKKSGRGLLAAAEEIREREGITGGEKSQTPPVAGGGIARVEEARRRQAELDSVDEEGK